MIAPTPKPSQGKTPVSAKKQSSILGFFQKSSPVAASSPSSRNATTPRSQSRISAPRFDLHNSSPPNLTTPVPSSEPIGPPSSPLNRLGYGKENDSEDEGPLLTKRAQLGDKFQNDQTLSSRPPATESASRRRLVQKRRVTFENSEDELDTPTTPILPSNRQSKKVRLSLAGMDDSDDDTSEFVESENEDERIPSKSKRTTPKNRSIVQPSQNVDIPMEDVPSSQEESTAVKWKFDPSNPHPVLLPQQRKKPAGTPNSKQRPHMSEPEQRYPWLANIRDADRRTPDDPEYDPRTLYIPPLAWTKFSAFEKQYWEIKQKFWDSILFFKKGKFYELYENDATVAHQLFDLKMTDRVNMRMAGVPEASLDHWANQFVAKGYKIARVDQVESALAKEMRERDGTKAAKGAKEDKVIKRELAAVFTAGTLVETGMIQDELATYCVAIKEGEDDSGNPVFGVAFVDAASARFHFTEFVDDTSMAKFETLVAQIRPTELLLEKSRISSKALRILKNNTGLTTIWNYLKPEKEFWTSDTTLREIETSGYFVVQKHNNIIDSQDRWPPALEDAKNKELAMSAFGALVQYLRTLKIDRELISLGNIEWYDAQRPGSNLVLDGKSLINLEIFANSVDGGVDGTLFQMVNRCVTPFGKRLLRQWICHPLADARKINARLDAVDKLVAHRSISDQFTSSLARLPDLERLISRIHAGKCRGQDFVKVLEGFEQIEYTIELLRETGNHDGLFGDLVKSMPDLSRLLAKWKDAFDRDAARTSGTLDPATGIEPEYDESMGHINSVLASLEELKSHWRKNLKSNSIEFRDNGKEIYQLEVPLSVKGVPKNWDQMSATGKVKRYYFPELRKLVRELQESRERHSQICKDVTKRLFARFDEDYRDWLLAVNVVAQLDCIVSLADASASMGEPKCRPQFVDAERTVIDFTDLRHPCMIDTVTDFIPNDIKLGGDAPKIDLLTGANAAGKSTVLRMTCVAVILAQLGMYLPCTSARLTPIDRIMSRLGANDALFAAQSTFFVELAETRKILAEATPRSLVILDELGRGTSSFDGVAVAQAVLHHLATWTGCVGVFATHYRNLAAEFAFHPEVAAKRMKIEVDDKERRVTFMYKLEPGVAEGSFGMHCAAMCGIPTEVIEKAEEAAERWDRSTKVTEIVSREGQDAVLPLGVLSDLVWMLEQPQEEAIPRRGLDVLSRALEQISL